MRSTITSGRQSGKGVWVSHLEALVAESYRNGRRAGHEDAIDAYTRLVINDECKCVQCLREALEIP